MMRDKKTGHREYGGGVGEGEGGGRVLQSHLTLHS